MAAAAHLMSNQCPVIMVAAYRGARMAAKGPRRVAEGDARRCERCDRGREDHFCVFLHARVLEEVLRTGRVVILVPTITLLDQWYVSLQEDFGVPAEEIACFSSQEKAKKPRAVNVLVINSGRHLVRKLAAGQRVFLIVDECHRAGSPENAKSPAGRIRCGAWAVSNAAA